MAKKVKCLFLVCLLFFCSCRTVYIKPELPVYDIPKPERPKVDTEIELKRYALKLEAYINDFLTFYEGVRK